MLERLPGYLQEPNEINCKGALVKMKNKNTQTNECLNKMPCGKKIMDNENSEAYIENMPELEWHICRRLFENAFEITWQKEQVSAVLRRYSCEAKFK